MAQHSRLDLVAPSTSYSQAPVSLAHITTNNHNHINVVSNGTDRASTTAALATPIHHGPLTALSLASSAVDTTTTTTKKSTSHADHQNANQATIFKTSNPIHGNEKPESERKGVESIINRAVAAAATAAPTTHSADRDASGQAQKCEHQRATQQAQPDNNRTFNNSQSNFLKSRTTNKENCPISYNSQGRNSSQNRGACEQQQTLNGGSCININRPEQQLKEAKQPPPLANNNCNNLISAKNFQERASFKINTNKEQEINNLDGRRTLIKNQLYLIEQLQVENANLRNERDHLQLENEELKFQLQMISSSNILSADSQVAPTATSANNSNRNRSDAATSCLSDTTHYFAGKHQSLDQFQSIATAPTTTTTTANHFPGQLIGHSPPTNANEESANCPMKTASHYQSNGFIGGECAGGSYAATGILLHATPLRRPFKESCKLSCGSIREQNADLQLHSKILIHDGDCHHDNHDDHAFKLICDNDGEKFKRSRLYSSSGHQQGNVAHLEPTLISETSKTTTTSGKLNHCDHDERFQMRLFAQRFGDNPDQLELAAVIIQRAFRRYQICKRFRTITEQLRRNTSLEFPARQESLVESLSLAANQLIANTKAAIICATPTTATNQPSDRQSHTNAIASARYPDSSIACTNTDQTAGPTVRRAFSSQQVNQLGSLQHQQHQQQFQLQRDQKMLTIQQVEAHRALLYRVGLNVFNRNPEKGISYFIAHNFIENNLYSHKQQAKSGLTSGINDGQVCDQLPKMGRLDAVNKSSFASIGAKQQLVQCCLECVSEHNIKRNVADFLATRRGLSREKIGLYLGNLQEKFNQDVLLYYLQTMDFNGLQVDLGLRKFLQGFRLPGEAQKIERLVEVFASRYVQSQRHQHQMDKRSSDKRKIVQQNYTAHTITTNQIINYDKVPSLNKDEIFILSFAIIMLNTDLHSPSLKPQARMSPQQFVNNLRGLFKSQSVEESELIGIYQRIKANQISTLPDHMLNLMHVQARLTVSNFQRKDLIPNLCLAHRRMVCYCRVYEVYDPNKKERAGQHQREIYLFNDLILICKLANRRTIQRSANPSQESPLAYRNSFPLQGLGVELFQSAHYEFGIRLYQLNSPQTTLIMFNSVNKQDQIRFTRDLQDSIAEQHEMDEIKNKNIIDLLHLNFIERLRKHSFMHQLQNDEDQRSQNEFEKMEAEDGYQKGPHLVVDKENELHSRNIIISHVRGSNSPPLSSRSMTDLRLTAQELDLDNNPIVVATCIADEHNTTPGASISSLLDQPRSTSSSGSSTSNGSTTCSNKKQQNVNVHQQSQKSTSTRASLTKTLQEANATVCNSGAGSSGVGLAPSGGGNGANSNVQRKCSASSVFSHDSGLFVMSRDVSPNQSS